MLFITNYFILNPRAIGGGISEHYVELYRTFIEKYCRIYDIFWYSADDSILRMFDANGNIVNSSKTTMPMTILKVLTRARRIAERRPSLIAIIAYYYAAKRKPMSFLFSICILHLLRIMGFATVIADIVDPPVEVHITYTDFPSLRKIIYGTMMDIMTLKKGTHVLFCSNSYKGYLTKKYGIPSRRTHVIYHGSFPDLIHSKPPRAKGPLTMFYSGSLLKVKGIPQLIESVSKLREKGIKVSLLLTGGKLEMKTEPWVNSIRLNDWFEWVKILSEEADICVIPYPKRIHWDLVHHCKLSDYMAAGKPVVSMYGKETASILKQYNCGLIANNWNEFQDHIIRLYKDRELAKFLGENGRKAVEQFFNRKYTAGMLNKLIQRHLNCTRNSKIVGAV
jgi:glycosyltransferase involved in cell wall biosynthesis